MSHLRIRRFHARICHTQWSKANVINSSELPFSRTSWRKNEKPWIMVLDLTHCGEDLLRSGKKNSWPLLGISKHCVYTLEVRTLGAFGSEFSTMAYSNYIAIWTASSMKATSQWVFLWHIVGEGEPHHSCQSNMPPHNFMAYDSATWWENIHNPGRKHDTKGTSSTSAWREHVSFHSPNSSEFYRRTICAYHLGRDARRARKWLSLPCHSC